MKKIIIFFQLLFLLTFSMSCTKTEEAINLEKFKNDYYDYIQTIDGLYYAEPLWYKIETLEVINNNDHKVVRTRDVLAKLEYKDSNYNITGKSTEFKYNHYELHYVNNQITKKVNYDSVFSNNKYYALETTIEDENKNNKTYGAENIEYVMFQPFEFHYMFLPILYEDGDEDIVTKTAKVEKFKGRQIVTLTRRKILHASNNLDEKLIMVFTKDYILEKVVYYQDNHKSIKGLKSKFYFEMVLCNEHNIDNNKFGDYENKVDRISDLWFTNYTDVLNKIK